jgi:hypothetical protein
MILTAAAWGKRGRVVNISSSGALLEVPAPAGLSGDKVAVEIRLDGPQRDWMRLTGRVMRMEAGRIAVAFEDKPSEFDDLMADITSASRTNDRWLSVVMIDATESRRVAMAEAFRAAGCDVIDVATPLAAIVELGESHFEPDLIAIADSLPSTVSEELRRFVETDHPEVKLVRITDDSIEPVGLAHWLSTTNPDDDLLARIRAVLGRPAAWQG